MLGLKFAVAVRRVAVSSGIVQATALLPVFCNRLYLSLQALLTQRSAARTLTFVISDTLIIPLLTYLLEIAPLGPEDQLLYFFPVFQNFFTGAMQLIRLRIESSYIGRSSFQHL